MDSRRFRLVSLLRLLVQWCHAAVDVQNTGFLCCPLEFVRNCARPRPRITFPHVRSENHHCLAIDDCHFHTDCGDGRANNFFYDHDDDDHDNQYDHAANNQYDHAADNDNVAAADNDGVVVRSVCDKFRRSELDAVVSLLPGQLPGVACKLQFQLLLRISMPPRSRHLQRRDNDDSNGGNFDNDDTNGSNFDNGDISDIHNGTVVDDLGNSDHQRDSDPRGNEHKHICNSCRDDDESCGHDDRNRFENGDNVADNIAAAAADDNIVVAAAATDDDDDDVDDDDDIAADDDDNNSDDDGDDHHHFHEFCGNDVGRHDNFGARSAPFVFVFECQCHLLAAFDPDHLLLSTHRVNGDFSFRVRFRRRTRADRPTVGTVHWIGDKSMSSV